MPELPEVETLVRQLRPKLQGLKISRFYLRPEAPLASSRKDLEDNLPGQKITGVIRRGKYLAFCLEQNVCLWFHLGMTGQLLWRKEGDVWDRHSHMILNFESCQEQLVFRDMRRFGKIFVTDNATHSFPEGFKRLGPEPSELNPKTFAEKFKCRTGRIKNLLLNQTIVSGLGNIYADESLHKAGIDPRLRAHRVSRQRLARLYEAVCGTLQQAIRHGGSSIDDYRHINGESGKFQNLHRIYGRLGLKCLRCQGQVRRVKLGGRSSYFCPNCQK